MKLLLDENLSWRIIPQITLHYPDSSQVSLINLERTSDTIIWEYARQHDFVLVSKDSDFINMATLYGQPPKLILLETGNQSWQATTDILINNREIIESVLIATNAVCIKLC